MTDVSLPEKFIERLRAIVPADKIDSVLQSFAQTPAVAFRVNTLKANVDETLAELQAHGIHPEAVDWLPYAFTVPLDERSALTHSAAHQQGRIYVQNLSSMLPVFLLDPQPGEKVLDLTAAPGSKTMQMAMLMQNSGWISAVEKVKNRFHRLKSNVQLQGADIVHTYLKDGSMVWKLVPEEFDRVLIDAPCSSEARFDLEDEDSLAYWSERKVKEMSRKQGKLLFSAIQCLKPGGSLVYSTCSFSPEENEAAIAKALNTFGNAIEVESIELPFANWQSGLQTWGKRHFNTQVERCRRVLPNGVMEGFFVCKLRKNASTLI